MSSSNLPLPADILREIFSYCEPANITETCRDFAYIAHSIPSLWSCVHLGQSQLNSNEGVDFLRTRLERAGNLPLTISIGTTRSHGVASSCAVVSEYNDQISCLEMDAETVLTAGDPLKNIFPDPSQNFPALRVLSVRVDGPAEEYEPLSSLEQFLWDAAKQFPMLQTLALPIHWECIPVLPITSPIFMYLHTLILDGAVGNDEPDLGLIIALLHYTPQLETLWVKHASVDQFGYPTNPIEELKGRKNIPLPAHLPNLTSLAISVPGGATDLLWYIEIPALHCVHLDETRDFEYLGLDSIDYEPGAFFDFGDCSMDYTKWVVRHLAEHCRNLCYLALTSIYPDKTGWKWLLCGEPFEHGLPFPQLRSLSLNGYKPLRRGTLDREILRSYARKPRLGLRRLAFFRCNIDLDGSSIVEGFRKTVNNAPHESHELEFDETSVQFSEEDLATLMDLGVKVIQHRGAEEDKWWNDRHKIDGFDSHAYTRSRLSTFFNER
ncbi:hypothetical protein AX15_004801 [Amanita polypyramis BW_CC]|nr:hypothetical protein AX15_004801 [Amanita polypyramis BW_CC]